jgi:hypothetical protein
MVLLIFSPFCLQNFNVQWCFFSSSCHALAILMCNVVFFIFLSCSHNSDVQWCFCSSYCYALAIPMCNGDLTHLIIFMFSKLQTTTMVLFVFLFNFLHFPLPMPLPPQTHKLLDKVSQPSFTLLFFVVYPLIVHHTYCGSSHCGIPMGELGYIFETFLKLLTIIFDCNSRIQCLELCLLLVVNMILSYLFNCI